MTASGIPVDLLNPGQVFACLGLMEIVQELFGHAEGRFDDTDPADVRFEVRSDGHPSPLDEALAWLASAEVSMLLPECWIRDHVSEYEKVSKKVDVRVAAFPDPFPTRPPDKPASMPVVLASPGLSLLLESWGDETGRDKVKWWAGMAGKSCAELLDTALDLVRHGLADSEDPFGLSAARTSTLRFDPRSEYVPLHAGFSVNEHKATMGLATFPAVDVLAVVGLCDARPRRPDGRDKLTYHYGVITNRFVDVSLCRAALGCAPLPHVGRHFEIRLDWPGQENQARSITSVMELPAS